MAASHIARAVAGYLDLRVGSAGCEQRALHLECRLVLHAHFRPGFERKRGAGGNSYGVGYEIRFCSVPYRVAGNV